jgi:hypothetical protein
MPDDDLTPPKPNAVDHTTRVIKAVTKLFPAGGALTELLGFMASPLERRREGWCERIVAALKELQDRRPELTYEALSQDEAFVSAVYAATKIAVGSHQQEKLEALRNAVLNVAAGLAPSDDQQAMFLDAVDRPARISSGCMPTRRMEPAKLVRAVFRRPPMISAAPSPDGADASLDSDMMRSSSQSDRSARGVSSGWEESSHWYRRPLACRLGGATT